MPIPDLQERRLFRQQCHVNGRWCDAVGGGVLEVHNPSNRERLGTVPDLGRADVESAIAAAANKAIELWKSHPLGENAAIIGNTTQASDRPLVELITKIGGRRIVQTPYGRELPRIC